MFRNKHLTAGESQELVLDSYVMHIHTHNCTSCGCGEQFSQIFEVWIHPTRTRLTNFRELRPLVGALKPLTVNYIYNQERKIPLCSECIEQYVAPSGPKAAPLTSESWQETLKRKYASPSAEPKVAKQTSTPKGGANSGSDLMRVECYNLRGQMFTHVDSKTGINTVYAATDIRRYCDHNRLPMVHVDITRQDAAMIKQYRGIEDYRLLRMLGATRWQPLLFAHQPDGSMLLIDGSHTYVARAMLGHKLAIAYIVPQEIWTYFTIEGFPETTAEELTNSWSGVR